jgi:hypothetical protein
MYLLFIELDKSIKSNCYVQWQPTPAKLDDTGPLVCRPVGLPITAGCDTAQDRTTVCSDTSRTAVH